MTTRSAKTSNMLDVKSSLLLIVDVQEKLMPVISEQKNVISNIVKLVTFGELVNIPIVYTEQYKLGATMPEIKERLSHSEQILKKEFNCFINDNFRKRIDSSKISSLIVAGVETHICICQTALEAIGQYNVHVVSDAVSSRTRANHKVGIERMFQSSVVITSTEMVMFELLKKADTEEFKKTLELIK
ncbi:MAG: hydrolase [Candidatus Scalindua sp.]|nr:hydrolase [Candidatus Scalindua sp.]